MKYCKALNLKNMKEALINYSGTQYEMDKIWNALFEMTCMNFISRETWVKFFEQCKGWYITEDNCEVRDSEDNDAVVWIYNPESEYRA